jgi:hypothetical protein
MPSWTSSDAFEIGGCSAWTKAASCGASLAVFSWLAPATSPTQGARHSSGTADWGRDPERFGYRVTGSTGEHVMAGCYELKATMDQQFMFTLKGANGETILTSER